MHAAVKRPLREAAVGAGDHVFASQHAGEPHDALGHQLGMLDDVGGVADDSRHEDFSLRQLDLLPHAPLVLVARVRRLDEIGAGAHAEDQVDDVPQRDVAGMRPGPASPADVVAHAILGMPCRAWLSASTCSATQRR